MYIIYAINLTFFTRSISLSLEKPLRNRKSDLFQVYIIINWMKFHLVYRRSYIIMKLLVRFLCPKNWYVKKKKKKHSPAYYCKTNTFLALHESKYGSWFTVVEIHYDNIQLNLCRTTRVWLYCIYEDLATNSVV